MTGFLRLIRFPNLLMIALTQYLIRYAVIEPLLQLSGVQLQLSHSDFFLLSLSTIMIAAAGYIINDYFDIRIDRINKPEKVVVGKLIKRRIAMAAHIVISIIGIALGFYVGVKAGVYKLAVIHFISATLLWFYSTLFKKQVLTGNLVISFLTALVPLIVPLFEIPLLNQEYQHIIAETGTGFNFLIKVTGVFSLFAFLLSMVREIIKDIEDQKGDEQYGLQTLPIIFGVKTSKKISTAILVITIFLLALAQAFFIRLNDILSFTYILLLIQLPLIFLIFKLVKAKNTKEFHWVSIISKLIMLTGILYSLVYYYTISQE